MSEQECGFAYDHDEEITHEDAGERQYLCRRCGAEWWETIESPRGGE